MTLRPPVAAARPVLLTLVAAACALGACDKPKPRHPPPDPMAVAPPPAPLATSVAAPAAPIPARSAGLKAAREPATFSIDVIGQAQDPLNRQPAVTPAGRPIVVSGFAFDPVVKASGKGVDIVIDGAAYGTTYGAERPDVAAYFHTPGLTGVGFAVTLPAGAVATGPHKALVRVVSADGKTYHDGLAIPFEVK